MCGLDISCDVEDDGGTSGGGKAEPSDAERCTSSTACPEDVITTIRVAAVTFTSDHAVLKDYDEDWEDGGSRYPKPEWTPSDIYPISHTCDASLSIVVDLEVEPTGAKPETVTLRGVGREGGALWFEKEVSLASGKNSIEMTSIIKLQENVGFLLLELSGNSKGRAPRLRTPRRTILS